MASSLAMLRTVALLAVASLAASFAALAPASIEANGNSTEIYRGSGGLYVLVVGVQPERPTVGAIHFTITPLSAATSEPVPDAEVGIVAHNPDGEPSLRVRALNTPAERQYYDANLTVMSAGAWRLVVDVRSDSLGSATFNVPLQVAQQPIDPGLAGTFVWLLMVAAFVGGAAYLWYSARRQRAREGSSPGDGC